MPMRTLLCAISYFTRVPVPFRQWPDAAEMRACLAWLPVVGLFTGMVAAGVWYGAGLLWSTPVATLLAMLALLVLTGAMHEDGIADSCDGLGVPGPRERVLQVLKDPQMGTFGVIAVGMLLLLRYTFWSSLAPEQWFWIPLAEAASRVAIPLWSWARPYARKDGPSKVDFLREASGTNWEWVLWIFLVLTVLASAWLALGARGLWAVLAGAALSALPIYIYHRKVGGVTGDVLGAAQQCAWVGVWLVLSMETLG
jgi:adenosylcobinamide-GDP ribazoletransferase